MQFNFNVDKTLHLGIERLSTVLGYELGSGISVRAERGDKIGVSLSGDDAVIYYKENHHFFRELGILCEAVRRGGDYTHFESDFYKTVGAMLDVARTQSKRVESIKRQLDYMAVMGYNMLVLYLEDAIELEGRPYFGYMRGRYTAAELSQIDSYAADFGIEVVAAIQCYGHMENYLIWPEAAAIRDTEGVLLARSAETFLFLDELISTVAKTLRSRRIHIGMDEAWNMGRGKFLDKNGYVPPVEIFNEYMSEVVKITEKHGLVPMMWSDMYFRVETDNNAYYDEKTEIGEETKKSIPEGVELVFWHYGEEPGCDDYMIKKHLGLGRNIIFAGGAWTWSGHLPENLYMMQATSESLGACRKNGIREIIQTLWEDQAECPMFTSLFALSYTAELAYCEDVDEQWLKSRFEACTGASYEAFLSMSFYHYDFDAKDASFATFNDRFLGKPIFWQDILAGLYDTHTHGRKMSEHYARYAEQMKKYIGRDRWSYLYEYTYAIFAYLSTKSFVSENIRDAYLSGDRDMLIKIKCESLPSLIKRVEAVRELHRDIWYRDNKAFGWSNIELRYAGVRARAESAILLLERYLSGEISSIEELDEPRLHKGLSGFPRYEKIATLGVKK